MCLLSYYNHIDNGCQVSSFFAPEGVLQGSFFTFFSVPSVKDDPLEVKVIQLVYFHGTLTEIAQRHMAIIHQPHSILDWLEPDILSSEC